MNFVCRVELPIIIKTDMLHVSYLLKAMLSGVTVVDLGASTSYLNKIKKVKAKGFHLKRQLNFRCLQLMLTRITLAYLFSIIRFYSFKTLSFIFT